MVNKLTIKVCLISAVGLASGAISAQEQTESASAIQEVIVTARKRQESLQEVPLAVSVFGRDDILEQDLANLEDIGAQTPGFQFMNQGGQQPGRYNTQLQFSGVTTAQFSPSFATGALFIDGVYVLNGGTSLSLMDLERVEVIKGPQSAYFARNTFAGAVNLITRDPNAEALDGELMVRTTNRGNTRISGLIEGPIIADKLAFSLSGTTYEKDGHYTATDGGRTGDESTDTYNVVLNWTPTEDFSLKVRYSDSEDDDGAPSAAFISGLANDTCTGKTINSAEGAASPVNYICGEVPYTANPVGGVPGGKLISSNTILPADMAALTDPATNIAGVPNVSGIGLLRETERLSVKGSYTFDDYSIDFSYGSNEQAANWIRDFDLSDRLGWWSRDPQRMEDKSWEVRLTSPQEQRLRWLVGYSHYEQEFTAAGTGGDAATSCYASDSGGPNDSYPNKCIASFAPFTMGVPGNALGVFSNSLANTDQANVDGIFFAVDYDVTDTITAIFEGRWVEDELKKGAGLSNGVNATGGKVLSETFEDFLPRAILRWQPSDNTNFYISYAEGLIAGDFNTEFAQGDAREKAQYVAADSSLSDTVPMETMESLELGWKQGFADGRGQINLSVYEQTWKNIKGRSSFLINETCKAADIGTAQCADGSLGQPKTNPAGEPFFNSRNQLIPGDATIRGLEAELKFAATDSLLLEANFSIIDSEYDDYLFNFVKPIAGFSQMAGNGTPRQPKQTATISATYDFTMMGKESYARADLFHQGKAYVDESNLAYVGAYEVVNLRAGMMLGETMVELFINNAFDEEAWQTGARWTDFSSPSQFAFLTAKQGVAASPLDRREVGMRINHRF